MTTYHDLGDTPFQQAMAWLEQIAANLRPSDLDEMRASNPLPNLDPDPFVLLVVSVQLSRYAVVICDDGEAICVFGAGPTGEPDEGCVWMLGTPKMQKRSAARSIIENTAIYLNRYHGDWRSLSNYVDARNHVSLKWLLANGFEITDVDLTHGRERRPFYLMTRTQEGPTHL